ncbi:MAG: cytochrome b/b6 domain-containing protein [Pseudomonadota bacterium]
MAKVFHWGFIGVLAYAWLKQVDEVEELEDASFLMEEFLFATVFLLLRLARFIYMRSTRPSALPASTPKRAKRLARAVHLAIYGSLALLAITGLAIGGMFAAGVSEGFVFGTVLWLHEVFYWASVNFIALHVIAALYHRYLGDGIWSSMVPVFKEKANRH